DVAAILGPTAPAPLALRLVEWMRDPNLDSRYLASAGAVLQLGVTGAALAVWIALERAGAAIRDALCASGRRCRRDRLPALCGLAAIALSVLAIGSGLATLALW